MAIRIILDHPRRVTGAGILRWLLSIFGVALVVSAFLAASFAVPATIMLAGYHAAPLILGKVSPWLPAGITSAVKSAVLVQLPHWMDRVAGGPAGGGPSWFLHADLVAVAAAVAGRLAGPPLQRIRRRQALFLRRFGYNQATAAVTFATRMIGSTWRLVTLDDASVAPLWPHPIGACYRRAPEGDPGSRRAGGAAGQCVVHRRGNGPTVATYPREICGSEAPVAIRCSGSAGLP